MVISPFLFIGLSGGIGYLQGSSMAKNSKIAVVTTVPSVEDGLKAVSYTHLAKFANFDIGKILGLSNYLMTMVLPFNLIEGVIFAVSFWLLYVLLKPTLKHYER